MKPITGNAIRQAFIDFFQSKGHTHVASSSLVPAGDPTLLFTNAGMNQFKDVFLGLEQRPYNRAVTAQKCVRAGGKHNDLEDVGFTARHQTFFEMLGNFSFGDYFKDDALAYAWEFITSPQWLGLPKDNLWVTIYKEDDQAYEIWRKLDVPAERIVRLGEKDNFWRMGDTGPCGPCSEIFMDMGPDHSCGRPDCAIDTCGCDRWREFWNNVFMQYNQSADGTLTPLARTGVDTGLGLERTATLMQHVWSNYDTDLLRSIIEYVGSLCGRSYDEGPAGLPFRVISDHARCCTFLIADGVRFSNEGRGYVMRRILRRAVRFGRALGFTAPFMYRVVPAGPGRWGDAYPEIREQESNIQDEIQREEERFFRTLDEGMKRLEEVLARPEVAAAKVVSGVDAFTLYDTYGFPLDIVKDVARERGCGVDEAGFQAAMAGQRQRSKAARDVKYTGEALQAFADNLRSLAPTAFLGYTELTAPATVLAVLDSDGSLINSAGPGDDAIVVLDRTPFYAESGGQVGDSGSITASGLTLRVEDTKKLPSGHFLHYASMEQGLVQAGTAVEAAVDSGRRTAIIKNHTATHLLHKALREVLGTHVHQAGSLVAPDRLRFDFTHNGPMTTEQLIDVEERVNRVVEAGTAVHWTQMPIAEARALGAMALFGEKYGDIVRVVSVGDYSKELCGGTHCNTVAQIGVFKIVSESGIGSGQRRIEAVTGRGAYEHFRREEEQLVAVAEVLKTRPDDVLSRARDVATHLRQLEKELEQAQAQLARGEADELIAGARDVGGVPVVAGRLAAGGMEELRAMADLLRDKLGTAAVVLATAAEGKVSLVAAATKDAVARGVHAGNLIRQVAQAVGGSGGGRPDLAQAGGKEPEKLAAALAQVPDLVAAQLK